MTHGGVEVGFFLEGAFARAGGGAGEELVEEGALGVTVEFAGVLESGFFEMVGFADGFWVER